MENNLSECNDEHVQIDLDLPLSVCEEIYDALERHSERLEYIGYNNEEGAIDVLRSHAYQAIDDLINMLIHCSDEELDDIIDKERHIIAERELIEMGLIEDDSIDNRECESCGNSLAHAPDGIFRCHGCGQEVNSESIPSVSLELDSI